MDRAILGFGDPRQPGGDLAQVGGRASGSKNREKYKILKFSEMVLNASKRCLRVGLSHRNPLLGPRRCSGDGFDPSYKFNGKMRTQPWGSQILNWTRKVAGAARVCCLSHANPLPTKAVPTILWLFPCAFGGNIAQSPIALPNF